MKVLKKKARSGIFRRDRIDKRTMAVCAALVVALTITIFVAAAYDPTSDPFVTLSYINNTLKTQLDEEYLQKMGYNSYSELKNAIKAGVSIDTNAIVENAKSGFLSELGYSSWSKLKNDITAGVSDSDRKSLNSYIQNNFLEKLGFDSASELKSEIEAGKELTQDQKDEVGAEAISKLLSELGYESVEELKNALSVDHDANIEFAANKAIDQLCTAFGYGSLDELTAALKNDDSHIYRKVTFKRGDVITAVSQCEVVVKDGYCAFESYLGSGTNMTLGNVPNDGEIMNENTYLLLEGGSRLIVVGGNLTVMIRGTYNVTQVNAE
ncbi:MAG: hypothetical protein J6L23_05995 [Clostridia bacterium]|nr:hypothetical protein [Clostridia bacterium]MBQ6905715.1 hypothetical protein [Clostridia bacterium]